MTDVPPASSVTPASRWTVPGLVALALIPVTYLMVRSLLAMRNAAYWDEIETVLDFLLKVRASTTWPDTLAQLFSTGNEHRTMTSRLLFAVSYWLTGSVNFVVIGIIGNLFIFGVGAVLIATAGTLVRRVQLGVICAFLFFQLQHFENFFWSGASIDHFQVVMLATVSFAALAQGKRGGVLLAGLSGLLATFTLAHGLLVWPIGALALAYARRWRHLGLWGVLAAMAVGGFLLGYAFNTGHAIGDRSVDGLGRVAHYWLSLLGAPLALGNPVLAPFLGAALLILLGTQLRPTVLTRERVALPLALWAVGALLLLAVGRVDVVGGHVHSRYYVLGCLVWALVIFVQLNEWHDPVRPYRALLRTLPVLVVFNVAANLFAASDARSWTICRDSALHYFLHYGRDGMGPFSLHPIPAYTIRVTKQVEEAGIFRMPEQCHEREFRDARPVGNLIYYIDRIPVDNDVVAIEGWAGFPGRESKPGQIHVVLQSDESRRIFTTISWERPDVSAAHPAEKWRSAGFRFQLRRWNLPRENFQIGLLVQSERGAEFIMTAHRLDLTQGQGILATGN